MPAHHTLYGVDIKLPPDSPPRIIELNGVDSGTDFYKMPDHGEQFYRAAARQLSTAAGGRPLYIQTEPYTGKKRPGDQRKARTDTERLPAPFNKLEDLLLDFEKDWLRHLRRDTAAFNRDYQEDGYPPEGTFYAAGAEKEGIPAKLFTDVTKSGTRPGLNWLNTLQRSGGFTGPYKDDRQRHWPVGPTGGLVWARSETLYDLLGLYAKPNPGFLNTPLLEYFLENKGILYSMLERSSGATSESRLIPNTVTHVPGFSSPDYLRHMVGIFPEDRVVVKPATGCCGIGTRVLAKEQLLNDIKTSMRPMTYDVSHISRLAGNLSALHHSFIIQRFVPSKPVIAERDGKPRDGCIRAIVIDGTYVGGQWRLAPVPMDADASLEARFRCNLSRGAFAQRLTDDEESLVARFAENAVRKFEAAAERYVRKPAAKDNAMEIWGALTELSDPGTQTSATTAVCVRSLGDALASGAANGKKHLAGLLGGVQTENDIEALLAALAAKDRRSL